MLSFENDIGTPLALIGKKTLSVVPKQIDDGFKSYKTKGDDTIQQVPDKSRERDILYITAPSGSGKSYYTLQYTKEYHKMFPKRPIYLFSSLETDETIDKLKYIKRVKIKTETFMSTDFTIDDFKDCLLIFDDVDCITDKTIKKKVFNILNLVLQTGRHTKTSVIYTSHLATQGNDTKIILAEAHSVVIFPKNAGGRTLKYLLDQYFGLDKNEIKRLKNLAGRWVAICKTYPMVVLSEKEAFLLRPDNEV
jgi:hypothetical protein